MVIVARFNIAKWNREHRKKKRGAQITRRTSKPMAKRSRSRRIGGRVGSGFRSVTGNPTVKAAMAGIGGATLVSALVNQFAPQFSPVARIGGAYVGGGITGIVADMIMSGGLGGLFGGGQTSGGDAI